jgi:hypothetical protein
MLTVSPSFLFFVVANIRNCARERIRVEGEASDFQSTALPTELPSRDDADHVAPWGVHYATM